MDFYVRAVYEANHLHSIQRMKQRISQAAASVTPDVPGCVWQEMEYRTCLQSHQCIPNIILITYGGEKTILAVFQFNSYLMYVPYSI
jgi:hypothetical protein